MDQKGFDVRQWTEVYHQSNRPVHFLAMRSRTAPLAFLWAGDDSRRLCEIDAFCGGAVTRLYDGSGSSSGAAGALVPGATPDFAEGLATRVAARTGLVQVFVACSAVAGVAEDLLLQRWIEKRLVDFFCAK
eukprot:m51a1_g8450 hypothetical protein (131) ;mRNA; r:400349-400807